MSTVDWKLSRGTFQFDPMTVSLRTRGVMGILNVTPDSFSDGGHFTNVDIAISHAEEMIHDGALVVDVGGESSRPGADPVTLDEELSRVIPVIQRLRAAHDVLISVDTVKSKVARAALEAGADIVNDISAGRADPEMADVVRSYSAGFVLMHMRGTPKNMQKGDLHTDCIVTDVLDFFRERIDFMRAAGIKNEQLCLDPGIGFGKTIEQNFSLSRSLRTMEVLGRPLLFGISRKSCLGAVVDRPALQRDAASLAGDIWALQQGASMLRVHNVPQTIDAIKVWDKLTNGVFKRG